MSASNTREKTCHVLERSLSGPSKCVLGFQKGTLESGWEGAAGGWFPLFNLFHILNSHIRFNFERETEGDVNDLVWCALLSDTGKQASRGVKELPKVIRGVRSGPSRVWPWLPRYVSKLCNAVPLLSLSFSLIQWTLSRQVSSPNRDPNVSGKS